MPSIAAVRKSFSRAIDDASHGATVPVTRRGKPVAAIVSYEMAKLIEEAEDAVLADMATKALRRAKGRFVLVGDVRSLLK